MRANSKRAYKIGILTYAMNCGGMEMIILGTAKYLKGQGMDVEVVTLEQKGEFFSQIGEHGLKSFYLQPWSLANKAGKILHGLRTAIFLIERNYDFIFLHHTSYGQHALPLLRLFRNTRCIPVLHNSVPVIFDVGLMHPFFWDAAVAVSPLVYRMAMERKKKKTIITILNGVEAPNSQDKNLSRDRNRVSKLVFVGRLHQDKGVNFLPEILLKCVENNLPVTLTIIGSGVEEEKLKDMFRKRRLMNHVAFCGTLTSDEVYRVLCSSHLLLMPSYFEGFPVVSLEAQICGCVPIASKLEDSTTIAIEDKQTGFLIDQNSNVNLFFDKIKYVAENPLIWQTMSAKAREHAMEKFSIEKMGEQYKNLIEKLA